MTDSPQNIVKVAGSAATPNASRYLQQLCKHWGHRFRAEFDPTHGVVDFGDGGLVEMDADSAALAVTLHCTENDVEMVKDMFVEHIDRFAHKENGLTFTWKAPVAA